MSTFDIAVSSEFEGVGGESFSEGARSARSEGRSPERRSLIDSELWPSVEPVMMVIAPLVIASAFYTVASLASAPIEPTAIGVLLGVTLLLILAAGMARSGYAMQASVVVAGILGLNGAVDQVIHGGVSASAQGRVCACACARSLLD